MSKEITVCIKLYSGIDKELNLNSYDPNEGITMTVNKGRRLKWALKTIGLQNLSRYAYFKNGERISTWSKLENGDEIMCLRPSGGG